MDEQSFMASLLAVSVGMGFVIAATARHKTWIKVTLLVLGAVWLLPPMVRLWLFLVLS